MRYLNLKMGGVLIGLLVGMAVLSYVWLPHDANEMDISRRLEGPSQTYFFGTDHFGRDIFSRIVVSSRVALTVGFISVSIGLVGGILIGGLAAMRGGWIDEALMRVVDAVYAFPTILFALLVIAVQGPGLVNSMIAIGVANVPVFARLTRGSFLSLKEREFVEAAHAVGAGDWRVLWRHLLPNASAPLIVQATIGFSAAILAEAALSYLGLGTQPPNPSWGRMLHEAQGFVGHSVWFAFFPGVSIALTVLGFNLLGDGLRDVLDPFLSRSLF